MNTKICTKCDTEYPATTDFFRKAKNGKYGLNCTCKECIKIYRKKYTSTDKYKKKNRDIMKKWRHDNPGKALEISRKNYRINGHKHNATKRERLKNDPVFRQKVHDSGRRYQESGRRHEMNIKPEIIEKARIRSRKRRAIPEKKAQDYRRNAEWRKKNREIILKKGADYRSNNRELVNERSRNNRENLQDGYIAQLLHSHVADLPPEIIETKRIIHKIYRELKIN